jgi:hypothetical protein
MKKLILSASLVLVSLTSFAQTTPSKTAKPITETTKVATETAKPVAETTKQSYTEVTLDEVPEAVKLALTKVYPTATLDKAYVNEAKEYKLDVTLNEKKGNLFADEKGNWIKK